jgi:TolA-binding protein
MIVRRWLPYLLAAVLGGGSAVLAACSDGPKNGLSAGDASAIKSDLDDVQQRVEGARCDTLVTQLRQVRDRIDRLGSDVDSQLRQRLADGADRLRTNALSECDKNRESQETETTTTETQTTPQETQTQPPETTTQPPQTTTPPAPTTPVPPPEPAPPPVPPPGNPSGGTSPGIP